MKTLYSLFPAILGLLMSVAPMSASAEVYTNAEALRYQKATGGNYIRHLSGEERAARASAPRPRRLARPGEYAFAHPPATRPARLVSHSTRLVDLTRILEREARRNGLDPLLLEVVVAHESAFSPSAVSPVGAVGLMQLMPGTADMLGVRDPFDPAQNVAGGARYLAEQIQRFGKVSLALAAYNAGPGAVDHHGGIPPYPETMGYVRSIVHDYRVAKSQRQKLTKRSS